MHSKCMIFRSNFCSDATVHPSFISLFLNNTHHNQGGYIVYVVHMAALLLSLSDHFYIEQGLMF